MEHHCCYRRGQGADSGLRGGRAGLVGYAGKRWQVQVRGRAASSRFMTTTVARVRWHDMLQASGAA